MSGYHPRNVNVSHPLPKFDPILAFRTITTMIWRLQQSHLVASKHMQFIDNMRNNSNERGLQKLGSLATLLVRDEVGVAAVASKGITRGAHGNLNVGVVVMGQESEFQGTVEHFLDIQNPSPSHLGSSIQIERPNQDIEVDIYKPYKYVLKTQNSQTFAEHAHVIAKLTNEYYRIRNSPPSFTATYDAKMGFISYVIAKCYPKMYRRITHPVYSTPFYDALQSIKVVDFRSTSESLHPIEEEKQLLFALPEIASQCEIKIPALLEVARRYRLRKNSETRPLSLYNEVTCNEYHRLLCVILKKYRRDIIGLNKCMKRTHPTKPITPERLEELVMLVRYHGLLLEAIVQGPSMEKHLSTIAPLLQKHLDKQPKNLKKKGSTSSATGAKGVEGERAEYVEDDEQVDVDLISVQPQANIGSNRPLSNSEAWREWLRLMVSHIQSAHLTVKLFRSNETPEISVTVVSVPHPGQEMTPWQTLLFHLFDSELAKQAINTIAGLMESKSEFESKDTGTKDDKEKKDRDKRKKQKKYKPQKFKYEKGYEAAYFQTHFGPNAPLSTGVGFVGTVHCEICIACLKLASTPRHELIDEAIQNEFLGLQQLLGVSKRCCPVCSSLLSHLNKHYNWNDQFLILGSHTMIYPCTLPPWLPKNILDQMVSEYAELLEQILIDIIQDTKARESPDSHSIPVSASDYDSLSDSLELRCSLPLPADYDSDS